MYARVCIMEAYFLWNKMFENISLKTNLCQKYNGPFEESFLYIKQTTTCMFEKIPF